MKKQSLSHVSTSVTWTTFLLRHSPFPSPIFPFVLLGIHSARIASSSFQRVCSSPIFYHFSFLPPFRNPEFRITSFSCFFFFFAGTDNPRACARECRASSSRALIIHVSGNSEWLPGKQLARCILCASYTCKNKHFSGTYSRLTRHRRTFCQQS